MSSKGTDRLPEQAERPLLSRYLEFNEALGNPISVSLSRRGFFSEVNCLVTATVWGASKRRRLIVEQDKFDGRKWSDYFTTTLPTGPSWLIDQIEPTYRSMDNEGPTAWGFHRMRRHLVLRQDRRLPVWIPGLGLFGSVQTVMRKFTDALCQPAVPVVIPEGLGDSYAAFHIRRGDKVLGTMVNGQRAGAESEVTLPETYLGLLRRHAPHISRVFVLTDDYTAIEELRMHAPGMHFETFCLPTERGYEQTEFDAMSDGDKAAHGKRLVLETEIAIRSAIFVGGFKSNVARYITLRHATPQFCFSADGARRWFPG